MIQSSSAEQISLLPHLFFQLFRSVWTHEFLLYIWIIIQYCFTYFVCSDCSSFGHWSSLRWLLVSLMYSCHCGFSVWLCSVFSSFLLPDTTWCSRLILFVSCPRPRISHISKEFLLLENGFEPQNTGRLRKYKFILKHYRVVTSFSSHGQIEASERGVLSSGMFDV